MASISSSFLPFSSPKPKVQVHISHFLSPVVYRPSVCPSFCLSVRSSVRLLSISLQIFHILYLSSRTSWPISTNLVHIILIDFKLLRLRKVISLFLKNFKRISVILCLRSFNELRWWIYLQSSRFFLSSMKIKQHKLIYYSYKWCTYDTPLNNASF